MTASPSRETLSRPIKVFEASAIARLNHDAPAFRRLMAGESAVFTAATAFSVRMIMEEVSLMRSQNPMHGPCQRREVLLNNGLADLRSCRKSDIGGGTPHGGPICTSMSPFPNSSSGTFCTRILLLWRPARSLHERTVQNLVSLPDRSRYASPIEVGSCKSCQILRPIVPLHWRRGVLRPCRARHRRRSGRRSPSRCRSEARPVRGELHCYSAVPTELAQEVRSGGHGCTHCRVFDKVGHETHRNRSHAIVVK